MNVSWNLFSDILSSKATEKRIPVSGRFEMTARCNFQCKMCYLCRPITDTYANEHELTAEQWLKIAGEARDAGMIFLTLTGGELLVRKDFRLIFTELSRMGFHITIMSNCSLIDADMASFFSKISPSKVVTTIYGASPETYAAVTGSAAGFQKTLDGIDRLRALGIEVEVRTTVVKGNAGEFEKIAGIADKRKLPLGIVNYVAPRREGCFSDPIGNRLSPVELAEYEKRMITYLTSIRCTSGALNRDPKKTEACKTFDDENFLRNDIVNIKFPHNPEDAFSCSTGKCSFWIAWDGTMTPCGLLSQPCTYPLQDGFLTAWNQLKEKLDQIPVCTDCAHCTKKIFCFTCPARLHSETGCFDKKASYLCEMAEERQKLHRQISANASQPADGKIFFTE